MGVAGKQEERPLRFKAFPVLISGVGTASRVEARGHFPVYIFLIILKTVMWVETEISFLGTTSSRQCEAERIGKRTVVIITIARAVYWVSVCCSQAQPCSAPSHRSLGSILASCLRSRWGGKSRGWGSQHCALYLSARLIGKGDSVHRWHLMTRDVCPEVGVAVGSAGRWGLDTALWSLPDSLSPASLPNKGRSSSPGGLLPGHVELIPPPRSFYFSLF